MKCFKGNASVYEIERMWDDTKSHIENMYNDLMLEERKEFLKEYEKGENRSCGYRTRYLRTANNLKLKLRVPRVREDSDKLNFAVFNRYQRGTKEFEAKIEYFYIQDIFEKHIADIIEMSCVTQDRKEKIRRKYIEEYRKWLNEVKRGYDILKVDATEFNKRKYKTQIYTLYAIWGIKKEEGKTVTKCLGYTVREGKESSRHWKEIINYILEKVDLSSVKLIVSDMNKGLKFNLSKLDIPLQNCLWHRLHSFCHRIKDITKNQSREIFYSAYDRLKDMETKSDLEDFLYSFENFEYRFEKNKKGVEIQKDFDRMISHHYDDNFTYFNDEELLNKFGRKMLTQTMDIESMNSRIKNFMKKYSRVHSREILEFRMYCFLKLNELL